METILWENLLCQRHFAQTPLEQLDRKDILIQQVKWTELLSNDLASFKSWRNWHRQVFHPFGLYGLFHYIGFFGWTILTPSNFFWRLPIFLNLTISFYLTVQGSGASKVRLLEAIYPLNRFFTRKDFVQSIFSTGKWFLQVGTSKLLQQHFTSNLFLLLQLLFLVDPTCSNTLATTCWTCGQNAQDRNPPCSTKTTFSNPRPSSSARSLEVKFYIWSKFRIWVWKALLHRYCTYLWYSYWVQTIPLGRHSSSGRRVAIQPPRLKLSINSSSAKSRNF